MRIAETRHRNGVTSRLDVHQAESVLRQSEADVARYTTAVAQDMNALELLTGEKLYPALLPDSFDGSESWLGLPSAGMDSNVLLRRPDVAAAEHQLKSANANIGAARAAFFPSITLFSTAGRASSDLSGLFSGGSTQIWSFTSGVDLPLFNGGARVANLEYAKAIYRSQLAQYEKSIQTAFREVADTLARRGTIYAQIEAQKALVAVSQQSYDLSERRYSSGVEAYLNVLQAQRDYYTSKQGLVNALLMELDNRITLYRVLGGGQE
jgi:multidrug efflux system outer membrane protein